MDDRGTDWITPDGIDGEMAIEWGTFEGGPRLVSMLQYWYGRERRRPDETVWRRRFLVKMVTAPDGFRVVKIHEPQPRKETVVADNGLLMVGSVLGDPLAEFDAPSSVSDLSILIRTRLEELDR